MYIPLEDRIVLDDDDEAFVDNVVPVKHCE
jgi:hypothetical protein